MTDAPLQALAVRPATPADAATIYGFIRDLAEYEKLLHEVIATEADIARDLFGPAPRAFCDIAEVGGEPVGFALWFYNYSTFAGRHGIYLEDLFVKPQARGQGAGKALLANLARRCVAEGLARLEWSVLDWNAPSIAFYDSLEAAAMDEWTVRRLTGEALARLAKA
ncbi:MAG: GNAT family N-acetyltransferase [Phenylobacterium sp.]|jgi:GNAT superfamily N-acetyltransferase|uniref:GNAT family N-acetyltransferase n=1 Tax=Phenylobacterium sp. TaxID=1871053 RepID=UPI002A31FA00|nr:GNAT family N-acetyltransferase [Phenylobacterium sp.]MDD3838138.1 GNAT family N-acetyltransferase [Phenylobacterium sp.]MDX9997646.1 GNAT family N-acetyltransferase [Phenylobacterium sp.]